MNDNATEQARQKAHQIYVSIGSNIEREKHIRFAMSCLRENFSKVEISPIYETTAVGFDGANFYNLVARFETALDYEPLLAKLKQLEDQSGRDREAKKFSARTLDIDILLFDQEIWQQQGINIPRDEILQYAFVLKPLSDLAPECRHPLSGQTFLAHWQQMRQQMGEAANNMVAVDFFTGII